MYGYPFPYSGFPPPSFQQYPGYPQNFYPTPPYPQHPPPHPPQAYPPFSYPQSHPQSHPQSQSQSQPQSQAKPQSTQKAEPPKDLEVASEQDEAVAEEKRRRDQLAAVKKKMADARSKMIVQRSTISTQVKPGIAKQEVQLFKLDSDEEEEPEAPRFHGKGRPMLPSGAETASEPQAAAVVGPPTDPEILAAIHNLAAFVHKEGDQFETMVKSRNEPKFGFLNDSKSGEYVYYRSCVDKLRQPAEPPPEVLESDEEDEHSLVGKSVEVQGVQSKPELNGQRGVVESFNDDTGRYVVKLKDTSIALKPTNMKKVEPIPTPAAAVQLPPPKVIMSKQKAEAAALLARLYAKDTPSSDSSASTSLSDSSRSKSSKWSTPPPSISKNPTESQPKRSRWSESSISHNSSSSMPEPTNTVETEPQPGTPDLQGLDDEEHGASKQSSRGFSEVKPTRKRQSRFDEMPTTPAEDGVPMVGTKASGYADSLSQMNAYFHQICETDKNKLGNEMESIREGGEKHHIGDYLPKEALNKFTKLSGEADETNKLTSQNKGYGLLAKMGWTEGAGLGKNSTGIANPIQATGGVAGAGIGANRDHVELNADDDAFGAYKKKMALSYRFRPNPLGNPRKAYWQDVGMNSGATQKLTSPDNEG